MAKGMPSLLALLGLVAVAGYQNRDKLRDMIGDAQRGGSGRAGDQSRAGFGGLLDEISQMFGSGDSGRKAWALLLIGFVPPGKDRRPNFGYRQMPTGNCSRTSSRRRSAMTPLPNSLGKPVYRGVSL